jgi:hypothetical protein
VKVPLDHAIFHMVFDVKEVPQVPDVGIFYASGGRILIIGRLEGVMSIMAMTQRAGECLIRLGD